MDRPLRAEIGIASTYGATDFFPLAVINLEKSGVLVHTATGDSRKTSQHSVQDFRFFDAYLQAKWQIKTLFPAEYAVVNHKQDEGMLRLILRNQIYENTHTPTFLMNISLFNGEYSIDTLYSLAKNPTKAGFVHQSRVWLVQGTRSECSVNTARVGDSMLFTYNFPKFSGQEVVDAALDTNLNLLYVLYADDTRRDEFFMLSVFDTVAKVCWEQKITLPNENQPVQAKLHFDKHGKLFIYGTYNLTSERPRATTLEHSTSYGNPYGTPSGYSRATTSERQVSSAGFFKMTLDSTVFMQNYADFDSIDTRISSQQIQTLRNQRNRRKSPFSLNFFVPFQMKTIGENTLLIGENVSPQYRTSTETYYDYYGRVIPYTNTVFEGYRYDDVFVWIIDSSGNVRKNYLSDISITLNTKSLINKTAYFIGRNETYLMFANATNIFYKTLEPFEKTYQTLKLQPLMKGDKVVEDYDSRIFNWYDSHFLVCGYQTIQNNTLRTSKRVVFYLSKISMD